MQTSLLKIWAGLLVAIGVVAWLLVLTRESRRVAQEESARQNTLLLQEIADHRATDRALQLAKEVAEAASLAKSRFLTGMSHELRTPLNSIIGYAQIAERDAALAARYRAQLEVMRRASEHLLRLADDILDIARIEAGKLRLTARETDFPALLNQLIDMFRPQAAEKGLQFDFVIEGELPIGVRCDDKRLAQILINLLSNALKFTRHGQVTLAVDCHRETTSFVIADSELGRGSQFRVRLLLPKLRAVRHIESGRPPIVGYRGARRHLLVADDQAAHRVVISGMLEPLGFGVAQAIDGADAVAQIERVGFDALLLDLAMGEPGGLELTRRLRTEGWRRPILIVSADRFEETCERLKARNDTREIPIIFMTALSATADVVRGFHHGAVDYVTKPVREGELLARIATHIGGARDLRRAHGTVEASPRPSLTVTTDGVITSASSRARTRLAAVGIEQRLPAVCVAWLERHMRGYGRRTPFTLAESTDALTMDFCGPVDAGEYLLLLDHDQMVSATRLIDSHGLTAREAQVMEWVTAGKTNRDIALILDISPRTVTKHLERIFVKLGVETRTAAVGRVLAGGRME